MLKAKYERSKVMQKVIGERFREIEKDLNCHLICAEEARAPSLLLSVMWRPLAFEPLEASGTSIRARAFASSSYNAVPNLPTPHSLLFETSLLDSFWNRKIERSVSY